MRISPLVRISRSGSGMPAVLRAPRSTVSSIVLGVEAPGANVARQRAGRLDDLLPTAVADHKPTVIR